MYRPQEPKKEKLKQISVTQCQRQPNPLSRWGPEHLFIRRADLVIRLVTRLAAGGKYHWRMKDTSRHTENERKGFKVTRNFNVIMENIEIK